jgi:riboflavin biosynthesis pyrimidine reductase
MTDLEPPIEVLFGVPDIDDLPGALADTYGGGLALPEAVVYANFISSIDGIVAIAGERASSSAISGRDPGDRFVMALLRAAADVVLIGAGTFRRHRGPWTASASYPDAEAAFDEYRRSEGRAPIPRLAIVTASGKVEEGRAAIDGALVLTTERGAASVPADVRARAEVAVLGGGDRLVGSDVVDALRARGFRRILTEGGPHLMKDLLVARAVEQLFLSVSPVLAGGGERAGDRSNLLPGVAFLPEQRLTGTLRSARRRGSFLFLRYELETDGAG